MGRNKTILCVTGLALAGVLLSGCTTLRHLDGSDEKERIAFCSGLKINQYGETPDMEKRRLKLEELTNQQAQVIEKHEEYCDKDNAKLIKQTESLTTSTQELKAANLKLKKDMKKLKLSKRPVTNATLRADLAELQQDKSTLIEQLNRSHKINSKLVELLENNGIHKSAIPEEASLTEDAPMDSASDHESMDMEETTDADAMAEETSGLPAPEQTQTGPEEADEPVALTENEAVSDTVSGDISIKVLSGSGRLETADNMADLLEDMGYNVKGTDRALSRNFPINTVYYAEGYKKEAQRLAGKITATTWPLKWESIFDIIVVTRNEDL